MSQDQSAAVSAPAAELTDPVALAIVGFLREIGIPVRLADLPGETFLPGIMIADGGLTVDPARLRYPGDMLHEAGHLAVVEPGRRRAMHANAGDDMGEEMMAMAWSYAAALHIGIDPAVVFHPDGYRGSAAALLDNFAHGRYVAVPTLQWAGMALEAKEAAARGLPAYPAMLCWLRPEIPFWATEPG